MFGREQIWQLSRKLGATQERMQGASSSARSEAKHLLTCPGVDIDEGEQCTMMATVTARPFMVGAYVSVKSFLSGSSRETANALVGKHT